MSLSYESAFALLLFLSSISLFFLAVHIGNKTCIGEYIALGQSVYGNLYVFNGIHTLYLAYKDSNMSSLLTKILDI